MRVQRCTRLLRLPRARTATQPHSNPLLALEPSLCVPIRPPHRPVYVAKERAASANLVGKGGIALPSFPLGKGKVRWLLPSLSSVT